MNRIITFARPSRGLLHAVPPATAALIATLASPAARAASPVAGGGGGAPVLFVSSSVDVAPAALGAVQDGTLVRVRAGEPARRFFGPGHWLASAGFVPGDVDGLTVRPGSVPGHHGSLAFSLQGNEQGFLDGDVLALAPGGGLQVVVSEGALLVGLGVPAANLDVEAVAYDAAGRLYVSLQANLPGTVLGDLQDGDVLQVAADGTLGVHLSESALDGKLTQAIGVAAAVGDVQGMEWVAGELWVVPQGPSTHDGGAFSCGAQPAVVLSEGAIGLDGAELDALARVEPGADLGRLWLEPQSASPGATLLAEFAGGVAGHPLVVLAAGSAGYQAAPYVAGFGAFYLDPLDPWLGLAAAGGYPVAASPSQGSSGSR